MRHFLGFGIGLSIKNYHPELYALQEIFKHLSGQKNLNNTQTKEHMATLGYRGEQEDSGEHMERIMKKAKQQLREVKSKPPKREINIGNMFDVVVDKNKATLVDLIADYCNEKSKSDKQITTLVLKGNQFVIKLVRPNKSYEVNSIDETLDLSSISPELFQIKISKTAKPLDNPKFRLVSVTIHSSELSSAGHYYVYKKSGSKWKCINDNDVDDTDWDTMQLDVPGYATVLVYNKV